MPPIAMRLQPIAKGHDVVVNTVGPKFEQYHLAGLTTIANALIAALRQVEVSRLVVISGAGTLEVAPGVPLHTTEHSLPSTSRWPRHTATRTTSTSRLTASTGPTSRRPPSSSPASAPAPTGPAQAVTSPTSRAAAGFPTPTWPSPLSTPSSRTATAAAASQSPTERISHIRRRCRRRGRRTRGGDVPGVHRPDPRRQLRRHVQRPLAVRDQTLRQVQTNTGCSFDDPDPVRPLLRQHPHLPLAGVGVEATRSQRLLRGVDHLDRV